MITIASQFFDQVLNYLKGFRSYKFSKMFSDWNTFEILWLFSSVIILFLISYYTADSYLFLTLTATVTGIINMILIAKGKVINYLFAFVNNSLYAYICYLDGIYGQALLFGCFFFPMQFYGLYCWTKPNNISEDSNIITKSLSWTQKSILSLIIIVTSAVYGYFILNKYFGQETGLIADSITGVVSVAAFFLMVKAYVEQWALWIVINSLATIIWLEQYLYGSDSGGIAFLVMWLIYLINAIYGYINWKKLSIK